MLGALRQAATCDDGDSTESTASQDSPLGEDKLHGILGGAPLGQGLGCLPRLELLYLIQVTPGPDHLPAVHPTSAPLPPLYQNLHLPHMLP